MLQTPQTCGTTFKKCPRASNQILCKVSCGHSSLYVPQPQPVVTAIPSRCTTEAAAPCRQQNTMARSGKKVVNYVLWKEPTARQPGTVSISKPMSPGPVQTTDPCEGRMPFVTFFKLVSLVVLSALSRSSHLLPTLCQSCRRGGTGGMHKCCSRRCSQSCCRNSQSCWPSGLANVDVVVDGMPLTTAISSLPCCWLSTAGVTHPGQS